MNGSVTANHASLTGAPGRPSRPARFIAAMSVVTGNASRTQNIVVNINAGMSLRMP